METSIDVEAAIIAAINSVPDSLPPASNNRTWTNALKRVLIDLGHREGYKVCAAGFPDLCDIEWMYDLVWYRDNPDRQMTELGLIFESEWHQKPSSIRYDFEKLLVGKAPIKVMVFQDQGGNLPQLWPIFEEGIRAFTYASTDEKYILAAYQNGKNSFAIRTLPE